MKICAWCITLGRPQFVGRVLEMFAAQTYQDRELVILDDGGQYENQTGDRWQLVSFPRRFRTLGEKNNACMALAAADATHYAKMDDDDLFSPWWLESLAEAFTRGDWVQPRHVMDFFDGRWVQVESFGRPPNDPEKFVYHSSWGYSRRLIEATGGYRPTHLGDDHEMQARLRSLGYRSVDIGGPPWYWYNRPLADRYSEAPGVQQDDGAAAWQSRYRDLPWGGTVPKWTGPRDWERPIPTEVLPRPF